MSDRDHTGARESATPELDELRRALAALTERVQALEEKNAAIEQATAEYYGEAEPPPA